MFLTNRESEKLMLYTAAQLANERKDRGLKLNFPEATAIISSYIIEGARDGKSVAQLMVDATKILKEDHVMDGIASMMHMVQVEATFDDGTNIYDVTGEFNFKDTFTEFMIGGKYFFLPDSKFKPYVIGLVGFSGINSKFNNVSQISFTNEYELSSSGLIASLELGTEYFFTSHISLGAGFSYNYVGTREFKLKTSDGTLTKDGFTTKMNYTNTSLSAGLKVYF